MFNRKLIFPLFLWALLLTLSGCLGLNKPKPRIQHYTLEYDAPRITGQKQLSAVLRVDRFGVAPAYNSNRIIYRDKAFKRDKYVYSKWIGNPGSMVTFFLARDLRESGLFKGVFTYQSHTPASFCVEGSVDDFFEWDSPEGWRAVLALTITLVAAEEPDISKRILLQKSYRTTPPCPEEHPRGLAETMSRAMRELSEKIILDVYAVLKKQDPVSIEKPVQ